MPRWWDDAFGENYYIGVTTSPYGYIGLGICVFFHRTDFGGERLGRYMVWVQAKGWYLKNGSTFFQHVM